MAVVAWIFGLWFLIPALLTMRKARTIPFDATWWSIIFPTVSSLPSTFSSSANGLPPEGSLRHAYDSTRGDSPFRIPQHTRKHLRCGRLLDIRHCFVPNDHTPPQRFDILRTRTRTRRTALKPKSQVQVVVVILTPSPTQRKNLLEVAT